MRKYELPTPTGCDMPTAIARAMAVSPPGSVRQTPPTLSAPFFAAAGPAN